MNAINVTPTAITHGGWHAPLKEWWPILVGLLVLYVPTIVFLSGDIWRQEDHWHEPVMLAVSLYLLGRRGLALQTDVRRAGAGSWLLILPGLMIYIVGRALGVVSVEVFSMIPVLAGVVWLMRGRSTLRSMAFPILFLVFAIPLPPFVMDWVSSGLKAYVSQVVTSALYYIGYPIAREGVVIMIGQYQLLVADACSGMRSLYSLLALGLLFVYVKGYRNPLRSVLLVTGLLPIGLIANMIRVAILALVTYHLGDTVAQGSVHDTLGIAVFIVDLLLLLALDRATAFMERETKQEPA